MTTSPDYLHDVESHLGELSRADRARAVESLSSQLDELTDAGLDPVQILGEPLIYAEQLETALADDTDLPQWKIAGVPVETRGLTSAEVRSRILDPTNPRIIVPRLLGAGWTVNIGALAVKLGLLRPDDMSAEVLAAIPGSTLTAIRFAPAALAGATALGLAAAWRSLPEEVATKFALGGRARRRGSRASLLGAAALGAISAAWAAAPAVPIGSGATGTAGTATSADEEDATDGNRSTDAMEDRLVRAAAASALVTISTSIVAATVLEARSPGSRWGLLATAGLPAAGAAALAAVVVPIRQGLRAVWKGADSR